MSEEWRKWEWLGNHVLLREIVIEGKVRNLEPIRIGTGKETAPFAPADLLVLKFRVGNREVPVIPGSSWKGVFRSTATRLALSRRLKVCSGLPGESCLQGNEFDYIEKAKMGFEDSVRTKIESIIKKNIRLCLLCRIFGSPGYFSHVSFANSYPEGEFKFGYRTMVAINRRTGAAHRGALFTVEYVEPDTVFSFELVARNLPNYALGLLAEALMEIHSGVVRIGGLKSRGFGKIRFDEVKFEVYGNKGIVDGKFAKLDPYDVEVEYTPNGWDLLRRLIEAWRNVSGKLQDL
ncbi:MAG: CRISPR-associated RAMP protein [Thermoprotei archaeon]|nr:MAG: CRISPR-associated RAMP protein [Thermoprotei archaeon]